jgi:hypothetical protein
MFVDMQFLTLGNCYLIAPLPFPTLPLTFPPIPLPILLLPPPPSPSYSASFSFLFLFPSLCPFLSPSLSFPASPSPLPFFF